MVDSVGMSDMKYNNNRTYKTRTQCTWYTDQLHSCDWYESVLFLSVFVVIASF